MSCKQDQSYSQLDHESGIQCSRLKKHASHAQDCQPCLTAYSLSCITMRSTKTQGQSPHTTQKAAWKQSECKRGLFEHFVAPRPASDKLRSFWRLRGKSLSGSYASTCIKIYKYQPAQRQQKSMQSRNCESKACKRAQGSPLNCPVAHRAPLWFALRLALRSWGPSGPPRI